MNLPGVAGVQERAEVACAALFDPYGPANPAVFNDSPDTPGGGWNRTTARSIGQGHSSKTLVSPLARRTEPFHIVTWATEARDDVRRQAWNAFAADQVAAPTGSAGRADAYA